jgi:hypothetical protein
MLTNMPAPTVLATIIGTAMSPTRWLAALADFASASGMPICASSATNVTSATPSGCMRRLSLPRRTIHRG